MARSFAMISFPWYNLDITIPASCSPRIATGKSRSFLSLQHYTDLPILYTFFTDLPAFLDAVQWHLPDNR